SARQNHAADGQRRGQQGETLSAGDESNGETHRPEARRRATPWEPRLLRVGSRGRIRTFGRGSKVLCLTAWPPGIAPSNTTSELANSMWNRAVQIDTPAGWLLVLDTACPAP